MILVLDKRMTRAWPKWDTPIAVVLEFPVAAKMATAKAIAAAATPTTNVGVDVVELLDTTRLGCMHQAPHL
jgi:hypothetical protein